MDRSRTLFASPSLRLFLLLLLLLSATPDAASANTPLVQNEWLRTQRVTSENSRSHAFSVSSAGSIRLLAVTPENNRTIQVALYDGESRPLNCATPYGDDNPFPTGRRIFDVTCDNVAAGSYTLQVTTTSASAVTYYVYYGRVSTISPGGNQQIEVQASRVEALRYNQTTGENCVRVTFDNALPYRFLNKFGTPLGANAQNTPNTFAVNNNDRPYYIVVENTGDTMADPIVFLTKVSC